MSRNLIFVLTVLNGIALTTHLAHAGDDTVTKQLHTIILLENCEVEFEESTPVGTGGGMTSFSILQEYTVKLGDRVKAKQLLGRMADSELRAQLATSKAKADSDISVRLNEAEWQEATLKLKRVDRLSQRDQRYVSAEEDVRLKVDVDVAKLRLDHAKYDRVLAQLQVYELEAQVNARKIIAPHDGVVVELYKKPGETVGGADPVMHIVNPELLRVIGHVNADDYGRVSVGQKVQVTPDTDSLSGIGSDPTWVLNGSVSFIDKRVDPRTRTCKIHALVKNEKDILPAGVEVSMEVFAELPNTSMISKPSTGADAPAVSSSPAVRPSSPQPRADRSSLLPAGARLETTPSNP